ncbi:sugar ABC transporter permease [Catenulispora subtropica]|uniref:Sugar ABC transporter permease n=1 Tax=Catenulispora subtropica TaxID=450798 RepID=A0ABP5C0W1_9ACTN
MARAASPAAAEDPAGLGRARAAGIAAPALLVVLAFLVFPALWTLYLGTTNYRLTGFAARHPRSVGADNYTNVVKDPAFHHSLWLTFEYVLGSAVIGQALLGFAVAWLLRDATGWVKRLIEALVLLAWILPSSVVAFLWVALLDRDAGTLNTLLHTPGTAWAIEHPMATIIVFNIWRGTAFSMLLYSAALTSVPPSQLATARMFGANSWQQLRDVVFPHIRGHVLTNLLLISLWTFNDFTPYQITAGGPDDKSSILPVYIYRTALFSGQMGLGAAISLLMLVINLVVALVYLRLLRERRLERAA